MPPQFYLLTTLAELLSEDRLTPSEKHQLDTLANGAFGRMTILPQILPNEDGGIVYAYVGDQALGGPVGRLHRCVHPKQGAAVR